MKLIDYWTTENDKHLTQVLWEQVMNGSGCNIPSYLEVKNFLKDTDTEGFTEYKMDDLIIHFENEEFELKIL
jgi:hypothetical protein